MAQQFLLILDGPLYTVPIMLFGSVEEAVEWAKNNPAVEGTIVGDEAFRAVLDWRHRTDEILFTGDVDANYAPYGYALLRFTDGRPDGVAFIDPYEVRDVVWPGEEDEDWGEEEKEGAEIEFS